MRTQYQVQNETKIRKNQKVVENNGKLEVKNHPKYNQSIIQQSEIKLRNCPSSKRNNWLEFDKGYYCKNREYIINKQKHQIDKKIRRQDHYFSTRLSYANKKIREIFINMVNTKDNSIEDMIDKLKFKRKSKIKIL